MDYSSRRGRHTLTASPDAAPGRESAVHSAGRPLIQKWVTTAPSRVRDPQFWPAALVAVVTVASGIGYLYESRRLWFFGDEWDFLATRDLGHNTMHNLLAPHNEHWVTIPILIYRALLHVVGLNSYWIYMLPVILAHCGACALLWNLIRRAGGRPWPTALSVALMSLCGGGAENLTSAFQITLVGPVFLGLLSIRIADVETPGRRRIAALWIVSIASMMFSGTALSMLVGLAVFMLYRTGWRRALYAVVIPLIFYLAWYEAYGKEAVSADKTTFGQKLLIPQYIWTGLGAVWQLSAGVPAAVSLVMFAPFIAIAVFGTRDALGRLSMSLLSALFVMYALNAWTRVQAGIDQAVASRYVYMAVGLSIPAIAWLGGWISDQVHTPQGRLTFGATYAVATILVLANMWSYADSTFQFRLNLTAGFSDRVIALKALNDQNATILDQVPYAAMNPNLTMASLKAASLSEAVPRRTPSTLAMVDARAHAQILVTGKDPFAGPVPSFTPSNSPTVTASGACESVTLSAGTPFDILLPASGTGQVKVTTAASSLTTTLTQTDVSSSPIVWPVTPSVPVYIEGATGTAILHVTLPVRTRTTICNG